MYKFDVLTTTTQGNKANYTIQTCAMSIRGEEKPSNEDFVFHRSTLMRGHHPLALMVVCDGMGGNQQGGFASELATHIITTEIGKIFPYQNLLSTQIDQPTIPSPEKLQTWLIETMQEANHLIYEFVNSQPDIRHTGTRLTLALMLDKTVFIAHIGDTRAYLWRNHELVQITDDHSILAELNRNGILTTEEVMDHPLRKVLSRCLGTKPEVMPELYSFALEAGDKLLLCSDGLWNAYESTSQIGHILEKAFSPSELCAMLIDQARVRHHKDDISAAVACVNRYFAN